MAAGGNINDKRSLLVVLRLVLTHGIETILVTTREFYGNDDAKQDHLLEMSECTGYTDATKKSVLYQWVIDVVAFFQMLSGSRALSELNLKDDRTTWKTMP